MPYYTSKSLKVEWSEQTVKKALPLLQKLPSTDMFSRCHSFSLLYHNVGLAASKIPLLKTVYVGNIAKKSDAVLQTITYSTIEGMIVSHIASARQIRFYRILAIPHIRRCILCFLYIYINHALQPKFKPVVPRVKFSIQLTSSLPNII